MAEERPEEKAGEQPQPPRIKLNGSNGSAKPPTTRIPPVAAPAGAAPTPIKIPTGEMAKKKETSRIELTQARPPASEPAKASTVRVDTAPNLIRPLTEAQRQELFKKSTVRVRVEEAQAKAPPGPVVKATPAEGEAAKKQTARIDLNEVLGGDEDLFKRRTAMLDPAKFPPTPTEAPGAPKTIRIKRPEPGAATGPIAAPAEPARPVEPITTAARKSETARIELPEEVAEQTPTRRKTIRIKRPEGGEARPLVVSQPSLTIARAEPTESLPLIAGEEEESSTLFSVLALAAVLLACVLIYVLAAQVGTVESLAAPNVPWPGGV